MTPEQQTIVSLINDRGLSDSAEAGEWQGLADTLNAETVTRTSSAKVSGRTTLAALIAAGHDADEVITAMRSVPMASELLDLLTAAGVNWSDDLTQQLLTGLVAKSVISQDVADVLTGLSVSQLSPAVDAGLTEAVTADSAARAWILSETLTPIRAAETAAKTRYNNAMASLGEEHTSGLTLQQLQDYCASVLASEDGTV